jgi:quercetin dioxygenase-like cupin family protein
MTKFFYGLLIGLLGSVLILAAQQRASERVIPPQVIVNNAKVRIIRWLLKPGEGTPVHKHVLDHVSVVIHGSTLRSFPTDGAPKDTTYTTGQAEFAPGTGSSHSFTNVGHETWESIAIELKK